MHECQGAPKNYGAVDGANPKPKRKSALGLTVTDLLKAAVCVLAPPLVFTAAISMLCFRLRFRLPRGAVLASTLCLAPAVVSLVMARRAARRGEDCRWPKFAGLLFVCAYGAAVVMGEVNYWYFSQPFFLLDSLKRYSNIDPAEADGSMLMDAGAVYFANDTRLATDLAMSYTTWDVYCVAPITTGRGMPSQGSRLANYDFWAVGVNCCRSGQTDFRCGQFDDVDARAGLRQVSAEQRPYFRLAVEQAEAAYNIEASHPLFFYWVKDPQEEEYHFFKAAFGNWVLANSMHFSINAFCVVGYIALFNRAARNADVSRLHALNLP